MKKSASKRFSPLKDIDTVSRAQFIKSLSWSLPILSLIGFIYGGFYGGIWGAAIGLLIGICLGFSAAFITMHITDTIGDWASFIYRGPKANWSSLEKFEGLLNQVRYLKMNKRFGRALLKVEEVLAKEPHFPEALLLKAGILWEGFTNSIEAKQCLSTIIKTSPKSDNYHKWASTLYVDIVKEERRRVEETPEDGAFIEKP